MMTDSSNPRNILQIGRDTKTFDSIDDVQAEKLRARIEPWLSALFQSEHFSVLLGSGFTLGLASMVDHRGAAMAAAPLSVTGREDLSLRLEDFAKKSAQSAGRGAANIEDRIRAAHQLIGGLRIQYDEGAPEITDWETALRKLLAAFLKEVLDAEHAIRRELEPGALAIPSNRAQEASHTLKAFLLSFASRAASRERLNIFTTNYDRLVEYGCDQSGIRILDRFVGHINPVFRASRLDTDYHYNPPGIRGEPRYLEGVVKLTKLHGSVDWRFERTTHHPQGVVQRYGIPFGAQSDNPNYPRDVEDCVMIYPNAAKDVETLDYPYAELFRDFAASICRPNSAVVTYGYGFGDDHINRILRDMLTIPSTHLVIISYDDASGRVPGFVTTIGNPAQVSLLQGRDLSSLENLVQFYLPKPALDQITFREAELRRRRDPLRSGADSRDSSSSSDPSEVV